MKLLGFAAVAAAALLSACAANQDDGHRMIENAGYSNVRMGGAVLACRSFEADAPNGRHVSGDICNRVFPGHAIYLDN